METLFLHVGYGCNFHSLTFMGEPSDGFLALEVGVRVMRSYGCTRVCGVLVTHTGVWLPCDPHMCVWCLGAHTHV